MKSYKSFLSLAFVVAAVLSVVGVSQVRAIEPSAGATVINRAAVKDQNGVPFMNGNADVGYKVWVTTDANPHVIVDEAGVAPTCGLIHNVTVSSGTAGEWAVVYDSNTVGSLTVANAGTNAGLTLTDPAVRLATAVVGLNPAPDAQFNTGAVVLMSNNLLGGIAHVYWRPCRGGAQ